MKYLSIILILLSACTEQTVVVTIDKVTHNNALKTDTGVIGSKKEIPAHISRDATNDGAGSGNQVSAESLIAYAQTLLGTPYLYASMNPDKGFDCSGFINYVFNHFQISVPRSSRDFENFGQTVSFPDIRKGDLILFTGTNNTIRIIGHIGIVTEPGPTLKFIHATSGKAHSVAISELDKYYESRLMRIARLPQVQ